MLPVLHMLLLFEGTTPLEPQWWLQPDIWSLVYSEKQLRNGGSSENFQQH